MHVVIYSRFFPGSNLVVLNAFWYNTWLSNLINFQSRHNLIKILSDCTFTQPVSRYLLLQPIFHGFLSCILNTLNTYEHVLKMILWLSEGSYNAIWQWSHRVWQNVSTRHVRLLCCRGDLFKSLFSRDICLTIINSNCVMFPLMSFCQIWIRRPWRRLPPVIVYTILCKNSHFKWLNMR